MGTKKKISTKLPDKKEDSPLIKDSQDNTTNLFLSEPVSNTSNKIQLSQPSGNSLSNLLPIVIHSIFY